MFEHWESWFEDQETPRKIHRQRSLPFSTRANRFVRISFSRKLDSADTFWEQGVGVQVAIKNFRAPVLRW